MSIDALDTVDVFDGRKGHSLRERYRKLIADIRQARIIRYALGIALAMALAYGINWPLSFLTPLLCAVFLARPLPVLPLKAGLLNMMATLLAFLFGFFFTLFLLPYPLVYSLALALVLFRIYYVFNRGGSLWLTLMLLLSVLMMPLLSSINEGLALGAVIGFVVSSWLTIFILWLVHYLVPDPETVSLPSRRPMQPGYSFAAAQAALKSTIVVLPVALLFIAGNWVQQLLVLIFVAIFTLVPDLEKGRQAGVDSLTSTLIGGLFAWGLYYLLVAVPEYYFFILLMFAASLVFGVIIFSSRPEAKFYPSAMTSVIVLLNGSMDAGVVFSETFFVRLTLILIAVIYVVFALKLLDTVWPENKESSD